VFGAPTRQEDHADRALAAALEIANTVRSSRGLKIGIGLNSGTVVAGNVGGAGRLEFSVIGDPVNVAARVEAATRDTGDTILLTERTRELVKQPDHPPLEERMGVELKARASACASTRRLRTNSRDRRLDGRRKHCRLRAATEMQLARPSSAQPPQSRRGRSPCRRQDARRCSFAASVNRAAR